MKSTTDRIAETEGLIARLEGDLAASREVEARSRALRAQHALGAAEGSVEAQRALNEASHAAAMAVLDSENLELAIGSARERLASLEAELEAERLEAARLQALELARERLVLAGALDQALAGFNDAFVAWQRCGAKLANLREDERNKGLLHLPHQTEAARALINAIPPELRRALGIKPAWIHPDDRQTVAEADPARLILSQAGELPPPTSDPWFERHAAMVAELGITNPPEPAPLETRPHAKRRLTADEDMAKVTTQGLRLVPGVRLAGGGGVLERAWSDSQPPEAA